MCIPRPCGKIRQAWSPSSSLQTTPSDLFTHPPDSPSERLHCATKTLFLVSPTITAMLRSQPLRASTPAATSTTPAAQRVTPVRLPRRPSAALMGPPWLLPVALSGPSVSKMAARVTVTMVTRSISPRLAQVQRRTRVYASFHPSASRRNNGCLLHNNSGSSNSSSGNTKSKTNNSDRTRKKPVPLPSKQRGPYQQPETRDAFAAATAVVATDPRQVQRCKKGSMS